MHVLSIHTHTHTNPTPTNSSELRGAAITPNAHKQANKVTTARSRLTGDLHLGNQLVKGDLCCCFSGLGSGFFFLCAPPVTLTPHLIPAGSDYLAALGEVGRGLVM